MTESPTPADSNEEPTAAPEPTGAGEEPTQARSPDASEEPTVAGSTAGSDPVTAHQISRGRLIAVDALIVVTTILAVVGMLSIYANRLLFNPDNWEAQSTQLLQNPSIQNATATYLV